MRRRLMLLCSVNLPGLLVAACLLLRSAPTGCAASRDDPLGADLFALEMAGKPLVYFTSFSMVGSESEVIVETITHPETGETIVTSSPGRFTWLNVTLTGGLTSTTDIWDWRQQVVDGNVNSARTNCAVVAFDRENMETARWEFLNAWPSRVAVYPMSPNGSIMMLETLTFAHEGCVVGAVIVNRPPSILLPGPHIVPVLGTTNFQVSVSDPDGEIATLVSTLAPSGACFDGTTFTWTATLDHHDSVQSVQFRADDQKGEPNSVVVADTTITVPFDSDTDTLGDNWEVVYFGDLSQSGTGDHDRDGAPNSQEYGAQTDPNDPSSLFRVIRCSVDCDTSHVALRFTTEPGLTYMADFSDDSLTGASLTWHPFADTNTGVFRETAPTATVHTFVDDLGPTTSGGVPTNGHRYYRIWASRPRE